MANAAKDIKTDEAQGALISFPIAAAKKLYAGTFGMTDTSGNATDTVAASVKIWGRVEKQADNSSGSAGDLNVEVRRGYFYFDNDTTNAVANSTPRGTYIFATDNHTVGTSDLFGTIPVAGFVVDVPASGAPEYGKVLVGVGIARPDSANPELAAGNTTYKARLVVTSLSASSTGTGTATLTGPAATPWPTQDGIVIGSQAVGDVVMIQEGTTNLASAIDAGPWVIANLAASSGSWTLKRPDWWPHGGAIVPGIRIEVGGEGTGTNPTLAGTTWKSFAAKGKIIGTDAPVFWPAVVSCGVTLASGTLAAARTTIPVRSHLTTGFLISSDPATAPHASTRVWRVSALTAGVTGTASVQVVAESAPGTTNASDVGQYNIVTINW